MNQSLWQFIIDRLPELGQKVYQQSYLVGISMLFAIIVGLPLGILISRIRSLKAPVLGVANTLQTIPSLALLTFFLPLLGIGAKPAILALTLYALLPVVRNTYTGIKGVPAETIEAAKGLGFTGAQRLCMVELPLALPTIISGVRIATAISVGIATLAAFIGAGGLGDFINQGLALNNTRLVMLGAIPAAAMALILDYIIGHIEHSLSTLKAHRGKQKKHKIFIIIVSAFVVILIGSFIYEWQQSRKNTVVIASKKFTEQFILSEIITQLLQAKTNLHIIKKFNLGTTAIVTQAMTKGEVDIYPEYTGTAYLIILNKKYSAAPADQVYDIVKQAYQQKYHIIWLQPFGFNNTQALAVRQAFAKQYNTYTISSLVPIQNQLIIGAAPEFIGRPDGLPGLIRVYGLHFKAIKEMDLGLMYKAIADKQINVASVYTTDGRIPVYHLVVLQDDKHLFPPYYAAPLVREQTLKAHPEIGKVLAELAGKISAKEMRNMNYQVDEHKLLPTAVAHQFLVRHGLIK